MAVSAKAGVLYLGALVTIRGLLFAVYMRAPDVWKLPHGCRLEDVLGAEASSSNRLYLEATL